MKTRLPGTSRHRFTWCLLAPLCAVAAGRLAAEPSPQRLALLAAGVAPPALSGQLEGLDAGVPLRARDAAAVLSATVAIELRPGPGTVGDRDRAFLRAANGRPEDAITLLETSSGCDTDPWCRAERAAYRSLHGDRADDPLALLAALADAESAARELRASEPVVTLARTQERLGLREAAADAWGRVAELPHPSPLRIEALRRSHELAAADHASRWSTVEARFADPTVSVDDRDLVTWVRELPAAVRQFGCDVLLPAAAEARRGGRLEGAFELAHRAAVLGTALRANGGDRTLALASRQLQLAIGAEEPRPLIDALVVWGDVRRAMREERYADAASLLAAVEPVLAREGSALAGWSRHATLVATWFRDRSAVTADDFVALLGGMHSAPDALRAHIAWSAGVAADAAGDLPTAVRHFDDSLTAFRAVGEEANVAVLLALRSLTAADLGRTRQAATDLLDAARRLDRVASNGARELILDTWIHHLVAPAQPSTLHYFHDAMLTVALASDRPSAISQAHLQRGEDPGRTIEERLSELDRAAEAARRIPDRGQRTRKEALIGSARAALLIDRQPTAALTAIDRVLADAQELIAPLRLPLWGLRARTLSALGRRAEAENQLLAAIGLLDDFLDHTTSVEEGMQSLASARSLFADLAALRLDRGAPAAEVLDAIERGRARSLRAALLGSPAAGLASAGEPSEAAVLPATEILELAEVGGQMLSWRIHHGQLTQSVVSTPPAELTRQRGELVKGLAAGEPMEALRATLGRALLAGLGTTNATLIIVPDPSLADLPWAFLIDPATGRPLVADRAVALAPSSRLSEGSRTVDRHRHRAVRTVGGVDATGVNGDLAALPGSIIEAQTIATTYDEATVLLGPNATFERVLAAPLPAVLHLATHAVPVGNPPHLRLVVTPSSALPSGLIGSGEIASRDLGQLQVVVLAGCATARARSTAEGITGLVTAFLAARVPAVAATLWPIDDRALTPLFAKFHRELASGATPAAALQLAQLEALAREPEELPMIASTVLWSVR